MEETMEEDPSSWEGGVVTAAGISPQTSTVDTAQLLQTAIYRNYSILVNGTNTDSEILIRRYSTNRQLDGPLFYLFIAAYSLLIVFGAIGNCLVVSAVIRKATMRTARNMFIINLAISDLLLCVITMPLTLMEILTTYWPLGKNVFLCKLFGSLQATSIFVSTISITAIALDRYHVIVYPTKASVQRVGAVTALVLIWLVSCVLAAPLFIWRKFKHIAIEFPAVGLSGIDFCLEEWPTDHGRAYYSIFTIIIQYVLPITVVSVAYARICRKLRYRMRPGTQATNTTSSSTNVENQNSRGRSGSSAIKDKNRVRKTNTLLISIALVFGVSWMPLNVFNVICDLTDPFKDDKQTYLIIYAICHMIGMSSACSNPVLYGWLNENFRKEFKDIWSSIKFCFTRSGPNSAGFMRDGHGSSIRGRVDREHTTVHFKKSQEPDEDGDVEQSTLITQVLDRHK